MLLTTESRVYVTEESSRTIDVSQVQRKLQWFWYEYGPEDQPKKDWHRIYDLRHRLPFVV